MPAQKVAIFGDYDVDGACSAALLRNTCRPAVLDYMIHIPDRITEGYGPNVEAIRSLGAGRGAPRHRGLRNRQHRAAGGSERLGLDTLVLDHHQAPEQLPEAVAIVNPNRLDDLSGLGHLCAAGVVFLTLVALNRALRRTRVLSRAGRSPTCCGARPRGAGDRR